MLERRHLVGGAAVTEEIVPGTQCVQLDCRGHCSDGSDDFTIS